MADARFFAPGERKGNRWIVARGTVNGKDREKSTKTLDPNLAQQVWDDYVKQIEESESAPEFITFGAVADLYKETKDLSKLDIGYVDALKKVELPTVGTALGLVHIEDVRSMHLAEAANMLYPGLKASTKNRNAINPGAAVLHFAHENEICAYQKVSRFKETPPPKRRPEEGVQDLLILNTGGHKQALLLTLKYQGWRITETLNHKWENTNLRKRAFNLYVRKSRVWKTVPMHDKVFEALASLSGRRKGFIFPWRTRSGVYKWLRKLSRELDVTFTPHMARHDFASAHGEQGTTRKGLLGISSWTNEKSVAPYEETSDEHKRKLIGKLR